MLPTDGQCQSLKSKFHIESAAGVFLYDKRLGFDASPSFSLGAGYRLSGLLLLNTSFAYAPAHQKITQATSTTAARHDLYQAGLNLLISKRPMFWRFRPYAGAGFGLLAINPHSVELTLGDRNIRLEPPADYLFTINFVAGIEVPVFERYHLKLEMGKFLYSVEQDTGDKTSAKNHQLNLGLLIAF